jgi:hypothetical protein
MRGGMARQPMTGGFGEAGDFTTINGEQRCISLSARFHLDENDQGAALGDNVYFAAMCGIGMGEDLPAGHAQKEACEKFRFDPEATGAATI